MLLRLKQSERAKAISALFVLSFFFASAGVFVRELQKHLHLFQQIYLQSFVSFLTGCLVFWRKFSFKAFLRIDAREFLVFFVRAFAWYILGAALYNRALLYTQLASAAFLGALPFCGIWGFLLFGEKFTARKWSLVGLSFLGVLLIAVPSLDSLLSWGRGEVLACIASIFFSFALTARAWHSDQFSDIEISQVYLCCGVLVGLIMALIFSEPFELGGAVQVLPLMVVWGGLISLSAVLASYAYSKLEPSVAGNILILECPLAVAFGYLFFDEKPSIAVWSGGALIITCSLLLSRESEQQNGIN